MVQYKKVIIAHNKSLQYPDFFKNFNVHKPKIPREERFCKFCTEVETEEHFLISCHKYKDIRKTFFQSYGLDLKDSHNTYFLLSKLLNPKNIIECNYLYKFIRDALEIRNTS